MRLWSNTLQEGNDSMRLQKIQEFMTGRNMPFRYSQEDVIQGKEKDRSSVKIIFSNDDDDQKKKRFSFDLNDLFK